MQPNNRIYCCIISLLWCLSQGLFCLVARPEINKQGSRSKRNDRGLVHRQYIRCTLFGGPLLILWKGVPLHFSSPGLGMHSQKRVSQVDGQRIVHKKMHICALVNGQYYLKEEYFLILNSWIAFEKKKIIDEKIICGKTFKQFNTSLIRNLSPVKKDSI